MYQKKKLGNLFCLCLFLLSFVFLLTVSVLHLWNPDLIFSTLLVIQGLARSRGQGLDTVVPRWAGIRQLNYTALRLNYFKTTPFVFYLFFYSKLLDFRILREIYMSFLVIFWMFLMFLYSKAGWWIPINYTCAPLCPPTASEGGIKNIIAQSYSWGIIN